MLKIIEPQETRLIHDRLCIVAKSKKANASLLYFFIFSFAQPSLLGWPARPKTKKPDMCRAFVRLCGEGGIVLFYTYLYFTILLS